MPSSTAWKQTISACPAAKNRVFCCRGEKYRDWAAAAAAYNDLLKEQIFQRKWQDEKKNIQVGDILDLPFPLRLPGRQRQGQRGL